jgi:alpha/beta superfamily hydrolase
VEQQKLKKWISQLTLAKPVIIVCHGYMSWRNQMLLAHLAHGLHNRLNCHVLRFDFAGNGHSTGAFRHSNYDGEFRDLQTVLAFVGYKMKCRVACVVGHSKGAATVLRVAAEQETYASSRRIPCFVNISGRFAVPHDYDVEKLLGVDKTRQFKQSGRVLLDKKGERNASLLQKTSKSESNSTSFVQQIRSSSVLTIHGSRDDQVDVGNALEFANAIANHELFIIDGADHNYNGLRHMPMIVDVIGKFVDKNNILVN